MKLVNQKIIKWIIILFFFTVSQFTIGQSIEVDKLRSIKLPMYLAEGLDWKGESTQNTTWSKITETPDGRIWFCGGDHWGIDEITGQWEKSDRYERPWGFGNTTVCYYDPKLDKSFVELELNRVSALYSNEQTPGHGKIHGNIVTDTKDRLYFAGYMGYSFIHEYTNAFYPKSYVGGALIRYDPVTKNSDYLGIPVPHGAVAALYYDKKRDILNGISVDRAKFWRVNLTTMELNRYESVARMSRLKDRVREMIMDNDGFCYFANDVGGLTKFDPDNETFIDIDIRLPGRLMDFRASVVSAKNIIYGITTDGFVWSFNPRTNELADLGHIIGMPNQSHYTPNIALDEEWERLYFISGNHGYDLLEGAFGVLTILDMKTNKYYWVGKIEAIEGCFGAMCAKDHAVYFSSFGHFFQGNDVLRDKSGKPITRPYLLKYDPPENLDSLR